MVSILALTTVLVAAAAPPPADSPAPEPVAADELFAVAVAAHGDGRIAQAIEAIRRVLDLRPDDADALWDLGLWTAEAGMADDALSTWRRYRRLVPDDWRGRAKEIQALQATGRGAERDREIAALRDLRRTGAAADLVDAPSFCRDQFVAGGRRVMTFEPFEPAGPRPIVLEFVVLDGAGGERERYVLASWDDHNPVRWDDAPASRDARTYHLARTGRAGRQTVTWYEGRPAYERVRADVSRHMSGPGSDQRPAGS